MPYPRYHNFLALLRKLILILHFRTELGTDTGRKKKIMLMRRIILSTKKKKNNLMTSTTKRVELIMPKVRRNKILKVEQIMFAMKKLRKKNINLYSKNQTREKEMPIRAKKEMPFRAKKKKPLTIIMMKITMVVLTMKCLSIRWKVFTTSKVKRMRFTTMATTTKVQMPTPTMFFKKVMVTVKKTTEWRKELNLSRKIMNPSQRAIMNFKKMKTSRN